jgi:hypothetical protein
MVGTVKEAFSAMTDPRVNVLVPYSRFLESQDRRNRTPAEPTWRNLPPAIDADATAEAGEMPSAPPLRPVPRSGF